jgi:hypothetical protein
MLRYSPPLWSIKNKGIAAAKTKAFFERLKTRVIHGTEGCGSAKLCAWLPAIQWMYCGEYCHALRWTKPERKMSDFWYLMYWLQVMAKERKTLSRIKAGT